VPVAPRSRYAAVFTTAVVGAGVVALGTGAAFEDAKLDQSQQAALGSLTATLESRAEAAERASRADRGDGGLATSIAEAPDLWLLPLSDYTYSSAYGLRWGRAHNGIDLAAPQGTPIYAMHAGTVVQSGWLGGYGYAVIIDHGDGVTTLYGHTSQLLVSVGEEVSAGERIALIGNTGYSFGPHLHLEVHVHDVPQEPVSWLNERDVDIMGVTDPLYGG
jgi:murein DD-endopeptidase MepM/ murein hydrolase activator NlpD